MIYTVIGDYKKLLPDMIIEEGGITSPFSLLPSELKNYIRAPKNAEARLSRLGGYLLLFHTVRFLYGEIDFEIGFSKFGKPCFLGEGMKNLSFNISHSGGLCAVTVSEEHSSVGVDIQEEIIDEEMKKRISNRLIDKSLKCEKKAEPVYLFGGFSAYGDCMFAEISHTSLLKAYPDSDFTDKWSLTEALIKCDGRGFSALSDIDAVISRTASETLKIKYKGKSYSLSTAVQQSEESQ